METSTAVVHHGPKKSPSIQAISSGLNYHQSVRFHHLLNIGKHRRGIAPKEQCKCTNSKYDRPVPRKKPKIGSETFTSVWVHGYLDVSLVINWKFIKIIGISRRVDCLLYISFTVTAVRLKKIVYYSANLTQTPLNPRNPDPFSAMIFSSTHRGL